MLPAGWPAYTFAVNRAWRLYPGEEQEWLALACSAEMVQTIQEQTALKTQLLL